MKSEVIMEFDGKRISEAELYKQAKKIWSDAGKKSGDIKSLNLYVQPENNITYFVINEDFNGEFAI
ncbi:MAG: DUF6465 family protein [Lachnospiraceae bacterium]|nr:DUF6465 family protein [Lachnospiraceae bacterium]